MSTEITQRWVNSERRRLGFSMYEAISLSLCGRVYYWSDGTESWFGPAEALRELEECPSAPEHDAYDLKEHYANCCSAVEHFERGSAKAIAASLLFCADDWFEEIDSDEAVRLWLTAKFGNDLAVESDGTVRRIEQSTRDAEEAPVVRIPCPGVGNIDTTLLLDRWAEWSSERETYVVLEGCPWDEDGRDIGDWEAVVKELVAEGDVFNIWEEIRSGLAKALKELL